MNNVNKTLTSFGLGLAALAASATAAAQSFQSAATPGLYLGASAGEIMYNEQGLPQMNPTIGLLRAGDQFDPYFAVEGRLGTTLSGGNTYVYGADYHIDAQAIYGVYAKGILPFTPWFSAYAIGGLGGAQWHRNYPSYNTNDIGLSFGVGAEFNTGGPASFDVEWARLTSGTNGADGGDYGYTADTLIFGVNWRL